MTSAPRCPILLGLLLLAWPASLCAQTTLPDAPIAANAPTEIATPTTAPSDGPHLLIVSIDGLRPDCLLRADTPTIRRLMARGSYTMWATTTDVAVTTPSHVSMLTGVTPERHGIAFNSDPPDDARIAVPTLFDIARSRGISTAMATGKRKFSIFGRSDSIDAQWITAESVCDNPTVGRHAAALVAEHRPRFMLLHLPASDAAGHGVGWGTPEQLREIESADRALGAVLAAYEQAGLADRLFVIVSADHGGSARTHGKDDLRSRFIPWIAAGPGIRADFDLTRVGKDYEVRTYDTFATACRVLNLGDPSGLDGKVVEPIFSDYELMTTTPTTAPATTARAPATRPAK